MYLSPKFERRRLALPLICLVLILGTFGIVFVTYSFYAQNNSLFSVKPIPVVAINEKNVNKRIEIADIRSPSNHHRDRLNYQISTRIEPRVNQTQRSGDKQERWQPRIEKVVGNNINSKSYVLTKVKDGKFAEHYRHYDNKMDEEVQRYRQSEESSRNRNYQSKIPQNGNSGADSRNNAALLSEITEENDAKLIDSSHDNTHSTFLNSETIYIDDYDRLLDNANSNSRTREPTAFVTAAAPVSSAIGSINDQLDINNIDYFDSIINDHLPSASDAKPLDRIAVTSAPSFAANRQQNNKPAPLKQVTSRVRSQKGSNGRMSAGGRAERYYYASAIGKFKLHGHKKSPTSVPSQNNRRLNDRGRYDLIDDDDIYNSDELLDNESIGSGSGDFIDEDDVEDGDTDDIDDTEIYIAVAGEHPGQYRVESSDRPTNFYSVVADSPLNFTNYTTATSNSEVAYLTHSSSLSSVSPSNRPTSSGSNNKKWIPPSIVSSRESRLITITPPTLQNSPHLTTASRPPSNFNLKSITPAADSGGLAILPTVKQQQKEQQQHDFHQNSGAWLETRARRIMGNVKKSEERSRQLLLCAEAGGGELCRMLFKGHINE